MFVTTANRLPAARFADLLNLNSSSARSARSTGGRTSTGTSCRSRGCGQPRPTAAG
ncbi:hypothetical protein I552_9095 [Mycobacterium xenopi 3993]|nr:hypothetical protein I552_9095 [Mycobacterium xenopi 3993]